MADRVDPLGGWFNMGDRDPNTLPGIDNSIAQPRSTQSLGMQPREIGNRVFKIMGAGFVPQSGAAVDGIQIFNTGATGGGGYYALPFLPAGTVLNQLRFQTNVVAGNVVSIFYGFQSETSPGGITGISAGPSITDGNYHIDVRDYSTVTTAVRVVNPLNAYLLTVTFAPAVGSTGHEIEVLWVEITVTLPG